MNAEYRLGFLIYFYDLCAKLKESLHKCLFIPITNK